MKRWIGLGWCLAVAAMCSACGAGTDETFVVAKIEKGSSALGAIRKIDLHVSFAGKTTDRTLERAGQDIALPTSAGFRVTSGMGEVVIVAEATDVNGAKQSGSKRATVVDGATVEVVITLGQFDPVLDGGIDSGTEVDGSVLIDGGTPALAVDMADVNFGSVTIGQSSAVTTVTVSNPGTGPTGPVLLTLAGGASSPYAIENNQCTGGGLAAAATCQFGLKYSPTLAGSQNDALTVAASGTSTQVVFLRGTGVLGARLTLSPATQGFGTVVVGQPSATQTFTVTNIGGQTSGTLGIATAGAASADFTILGTGTCMAATTLAVGASCTAIVQFTPSTAAARSAMLMATATPGSTEMATLTGTGVIAAAFTVTPTSVNFGTVIVNQSSTVTVTVRNSGGVTSGTVTTTLSSNPGSLYSLGSNTCTGMSLAPGASCTVDVVLLSSSAGTKPANLEIGGAGAPINVALTASVVAAGNLTISPTSHGFGPVAIAGSTTPRLFTVTNTGGSATTALNVQLTGGNASKFSIVGGGSNCQGMTLGASATCMVTVSFDSSAAGSFSASLEVSAATGGTTAATLTGVVNSAALLTISSVTQNLGSRTVNTTSTGVVLTVQNIGGTTTGALTTALSGSHPGDFSLTSNTCMGANLAPNASCTVTPNFTPTSAGARSATLTVSNGTIMVTSMLSGIGLSPAMLTGPSTSGFGDVHVNVNASTTEIVAITNAGGSTSGPLTLVLGGTNMNKYAIVTPTGAECVSGNTVLLAGQSCSVKISFTPGSTEGTLTATLTASATPGGAAVVNLTGRGVKPMLTVDTSASHYFGLVERPNTATRTFTIRNEGTGASGVLTAGATTTPFSKTADSCSGFALAPGAACAVTITYTPPDLLMHEDSLTVTSASPGGGPVVLTFQGRGCTIVTLQVACTSNCGGGLVSNGCNGTYVCSDLACTNGAGCCYCGRCNTDCVYECE